MEDGLWQEAQVEDVTSSWVLILVVMEDGLWLSWVLIIETSVLILVVMEDGLWQILDYERKMSAS